MRARGGGGSEELGGEGVRPGPPQSGTHERTQRSSARTIWGQPLRLYTVSGGGARADTETGRDYKRTTRPVALSAERSMHAQWVGRRWEYNLCHLLVH